MDPNTLSDVIRDAMVQRRLSAYALGKLAGVSPVIIQRFMSGERGLTLKTAEKITKVLNLRLCPIASPDQDAGELGAATQPSSEPVLTEVELEKGETLYLGDGISIQVVQVTNRSLRIVVECPSGISVQRGEVSEVLLSRSR
jgi:transcriptional regulator with XRE-family HTH domain